MIDISRRCFLLILYLIYVHIVFDFILAWKPALEEYCSFKFTITTNFKSTIVQNNIAQLAHITTVAIDIINWLCFELFNNLWIILLIGLYCTFNLVAKIFKIIFTKRIIILYWNLFLLYNMRSLAVATFFIGWECLRFYVFFTL